MLNVQVFKRNVMGWKQQINVYLADVFKSFNLLITYEKGKCKQTDASRHPTLYRTTRERVSGRGAAPFVIFARINFKKVENIRHMT